MIRNKRTLSWLLVLVMLLSLVPASAFADADNGPRSVRIDSNISTDYIRIFSAEYPDTQILCPGDGVYELFPGRYLYTVEDVVGGYEGQGEFTVTDDAEQTVTINVSGKETGNGGESQDNADGNTSNSDDLDGQDLTLDLKDLITDPPKVTDTATLSLLSQVKDEEEKEEELLHIQVTGGSYPDTDPAPYKLLEQDTKLKEQYMEKLSKQLDEAEAANMTREILSCLSLVAVENNEDAKPVTLRQPDPKDPKDPRDPVKLSVSGKWMDRFVAPVFAAWSNDQFDLIEAERGEDGAWTFEAPELGLLMIVDLGEAVLRTVSATADNFTVVVSGVLRDAELTAQAVSEETINAVLTPLFPANENADPAKPAFRAPMALNLSATGLPEDGTPVKVTITGEALKVLGDSVALYQIVDGTAVKVDVEFELDKELGSLTFEAAELGLYVLVEADEQDKELTLQGATEDIEVTVVYPAGALPDGVEMQLTPVREEDVIDSIQKAITETVKSVIAVDITFFANGEKIEPAAPIKVTMKRIAPVEAKAPAAEVPAAEAPAAESTDPQYVVHVDDAGQADVYDAEQEGDSFSFESDTFSVYAIVETIIYTEVTLPGSSDTYVVTVVAPPEAQIPEGSTLSVVPFEEGSDEYIKARNAVLADKLAKGEEVDILSFNLAALDISILDPFGKEIEPAAPVQVTISIKELPGVENLADVIDTLQVQHHVETDNGVIVEEVLNNALDGTFLQETDSQVQLKKADAAVDPDSVSDADFGLIEENGSLELSFEAEVFSTYTISWGTRSYNIHYVDTAGNSVTPSRTPTFTNNRMFLIYDVEGYEYDSTHYGSRTGTSISPLLRSNNGDRQYYNGGWNNLRNDIYVVYKQKTAPTTGGTPVMPSIPPDAWPEDPATPQFSKSSVNNPNGTNTVSLSISGGEKPYERSTKANVIVVLDVSGSMGNDPWRISTAKTAVKDMADTLLNDMSGVKMALVSFSNTATTTQGFTDNYNTFASAVDGLGTAGGTNWEKALQVANRMAVDSDAATFVVFVTDGDPTFRVSRGDVADGSLDMTNSQDYEYYRNYNVFGAGNSDAQGRNFDFAVDEVSSILDSNKTFYAIGVSSDVQKVQNLVTEAGGPADNAFLATDQAALEEAFESITQSIKTNLGFGDVAITDGITELANVEMKVMQEVDPDSFTYYKVKNGVSSSWDPESEGAGLASYDPATGAVIWNMSPDANHHFQLEDGVTYMVTFRAWPSQDAYDLVADLNNGVKVYAEGQPNSITAEERAQVVEISAPTETTQGSYALKTNTDSVNATYSQTSSTAGTVTVSGQTGLTATYHEGTLQNMSLISELLTVKKIFDESLDPQGVDSVTLKLQRKVNDASHTMADYNVPGTDSPIIELGEDNDWTFSFYVAPGFIIDGETLETGYQFTVTEPDLGTNTYRYDLIPEIVNPMVVDGTLTLVGDGDNNQALTAINRTRSAVEVHKTLYDVDGTTEIYPDTEFTITGQLIGPDGTPFYPPEDPAIRAPAAYYLYDRDGNARTGRLYFEDSSDISFELKPGEFIRFVNVPEGSTFVFTEGTMPGNYEFKELGAVGRQRNPEVDPPYTYSIILTDAEAHLVEGTTAISTTDEGIIGNTNYKLDFYNKRSVPLPDIELVKVDADDQSKLNGAVFELYQDAEKTKQVTKDADGNTLNLTTGNKEDSDGPDGWAWIGKLDAGTYYLFEVTAPDDYVEDDTPIIITVTKNNNTVTVTATKDGETVISGPVDGIYTITVDNKKNTGFLEVQKIVDSELAADHTKQFSITITLSDTTINAEYPAVKTVGTATTETTVEFANGVAAVTLADQEKISIKLPVGTEYTVSESDDEYGAYYIIKYDEGRTGTIASNTTAITKVTNERRTGDLEVSKTVTGPANPDATFSFKVELGDKTVSGTFGTGDTAMTFDKGVAEFTLKAGESKIATGLPSGVSYKVTETAVGGFTTTPEGGVAEGTITEGEKVTAAFTNAKDTGDLEVSKTVTGPANPDATFSFKVELGDKTVSGTFGTGDTAMTFDKGVAEFTLKAGESKIATGLPSGVSYKVTETAVDGFTTTPEGGVAEGTITKGEKVTAAFTNTREVGDLELSKELVSDLAADKDQEFTFTVTLDDTTISKRYTATRTDAEGKATEETVEFSDGIATVTLKGGESLLIKGLPTTVGYTVKETAAAGFTTDPAEAVEGTISTTKSTVVIKNTREVGDLELKKTVESAWAADKKVDFTFTITLDDTSITKSYKGTKTDAKGVQSEVTVAFSKGKATVTLKHDESILIKGLPTTVGYKVEETPVKHFTTDPEKAIEGTISTTKSTAAFKNIRKVGDLEIIKSLSRWENSEEATFMFLVEGELDGELVYSNSATITVSGATSSSAVLHNIPEDTVVTVTEVNSGAHYTLTSEDPQTTTIIADKTVGVSFTNDYIPYDNGGHGLTNVFEPNSTNDGWVHDGDTERTSTPGDKTLPDAS